MAEWLSISLEKKKTLERARNSLQRSLQFNLDERRVEPRFQARRPRRQRLTATGALLDLSRSGLSVEARDRCRFARGESHLLSLKVGSGSIDVEGKVQWTQSMWRGNSLHRTGEYVQKAGFQILPVSSENAQSILKIVRTMVRDLHVPVEISQSRVIKRSEQRRLFSDNSPTDQ